MGSCISSDRPYQRSKTSRFDIEPPDTETLKNHDLPILDFYVLISDVKVKKCNTEMIGFNFRLEGTTRFNVPLRAVDSKGKTYWKVYHTFDFMMNQYYLRKKFLHLQAVGPDNKILGSLRINFYTIWAGPFHQDFLMKFPNDKTCRVSFNCRISQGVHIKLSNTLTQFNSADSIINGTRLTFTMEAIVGAKTEPSSFAHHVIIDDKEGTSKGLFGDFPAARNVKKDSIQWKQMEGHEPLPHFNEKIPYYQIYSSSMQFTFWKVEPGIIDPAEPRYQPLGSCFIPLSRLMAMDYSISTDSQSRMKYLNRQVDLTEKTWFHGRETGQAKLKFSFKMQSYLRQMESCVRTEEGILTSTPVFSNFVGKQCEQIVKLKDINIQIQKKFISLDDAAQNGASYMVMRPIISQIYTLLEKQLELLKQTNKESVLSYTYANHSDLMKGQRFLIFFAFKVISYIKEDIAYLKEICWQILIAIMRRGEFKLAHMEFNEEEKSMLENDQKNEHIKFKKEISIKYIELMNELLKETLRALAFKGNVTEQIFAQKFCAYAYFRLPLFRQHVLEIIKQQKNPELPEWRGVQYNLYEENNVQSCNDDFYDHSFNWQKKFLKPLMKDERYDSFIHILERQLLQEKWKLRLAKRQIAFYRFLENLVEEIQYVCVNNKHIKWHNLPGYNQLLHAFLTTMKLKEIAKYSDVFCRTCIKLLANEKLLNVMVVLLLSRSNVNDPNTVAITFELIDQFFKSIKKNERPIHGTFDFKFLLRGIKIVLESEFQASISKVLYFIYDNFTIFPQQFSLQLSLHLMTVYFYRFFFHWSSNLRHVFQLLVFIKISRYDQIRDNLDMQLRNSESGFVATLRATLRQRYYSVLEEIRDEIQPQAPTKNTDRFYDKELYQKMIARLKKNKQSRRGSISSSRGYIKGEQYEKPQFLFPSGKDLGQPQKYNTPKKLLYFKQHEMMIESIKPQNMGYIKVALMEFNEVVTSYKAELKANPNFTPKLDIKKIMDEVDLFEGADQEW